MTTPRKPVIPTRIIPAGAPLPAGPPGPGAVPPWRMPPPAPPAPPAVPPPPPPAAPAPPPPGPIEVRVTVDLTPIPEPDPEPRLWERLWDRLVTWRMLLAILAALLPWLDGRSPVSAWATTLHQARAEAGVLPAYILAAVAIGAAWYLDRGTGRTLPRFLLVVSLIGALGVLAWWDPIHILTGVDR